MSADFTVVVKTRQGFGHESGYLDSIEPGVPFVGPTKDYRFSCPRVNPTETAALMFQTRDVDSSRNVLRINGRDVHGGIPVSPHNDSWNGNILLIDGGTLKATDNVLHIESRSTSGSGGGDIDDFVIDNVVVMYKTLA